MGLIKAALGSVGGVLADQWKEYFYCEAIPANVIAVKGQKRTGGRSSNTKGEENIISNGSIIAVADGQAMIIVEQGKVVDICAEPGEYTYDMSSEPSIFSGNLGDSIKQTFSTIGKRFTFGGDTAKDQRVYYFNTKELVGNKYGTPSPVPFRVVDERAAIDIDINVRCFGEYSYHVCDPILFYTNVCGNVTSEYTRDNLDSQLRTELLTALQPAFARISAMGIRYSALPGHTEELASALNDVLSEKWSGLRGIEIVSFGISTIRPDEESEKKIRQMQESLFYSDATLAGARVAAAQATGIETAAANTSAGGPAMAFMGMNMAGAAGGASAANLFQMGQMQQQYQPAPAPAPAANSWTCACGAVATGKFCPECGAKKPEPKPAAAGWKCPGCGTEVTGKFCPECGTKKPEEPAGWTCSCGAVNKGKFCPECGAKKPAGIPQYKCDKCGWEPEKGVKPPKFCPECGDPFDDGDIV